MGFREQNQHLRPRAGQVEPCSNVARQLPETDQLDLATHVSPLSMWRWSRGQASVALLLTLVTHVRACECAR